VHVAVVALALGGATLGFAPFNVPVARLFLGDAGTLPIGLLLGWLLVIVASAGEPAAAILLPLYYVADATITLARRALRGERIWERHQQHFYQRAAARQGVPAVVVRVLATNAMLLVLALATALVAAPVFDAAAIACGAVLVGGRLRTFTREHG
jgi:UDP-N-acetylmuramyl pentapeptide phosphotransferase/UDP-N-acetylglucosamine-1-phosphate transferase